MAASIVKKYSEGPYRVHVLSMTASAAEENIVTGLEYVEFFTLGIQSMSTSGNNPAFKANQNSSGAASVGSVGASNLTSGDVYFLKCYGR